MNQIKQIQAHALHRGADQTSLLLDLILGIPNLPYARRLLASLTFPPSTFLCNKLLRAYSTSSVNFHLCISLFSSICRQRHSRPNLHSFTFAISACATSSSPLTGRALHALLFKFGFLLDAFVFTSLIHMYCKTGHLTLARKLFDEMYQPDIATWNSMITGYAKNGDLANARKLFEKIPVRNVISWTSMISGYSQNEMYEESIEMFMRMWEMGEVRPNEVTLTSILPACANVGAMELGEKIEAFARENNLLRNVFVGSALVEMYAKCGDIDRAMMVFREVGERTNVCSWNSMIMGLAVHGRWKDSLQLFDEMKERGITPVDITFTGVLMACTHGGLVEEGKRFFRSMENELLIPPKIQHYGCMVDLLGRAGHLNEAYDLVRKMPMEPDAAIWGALLGACSFHRNVELAEMAAEFLFKLEPWNPGL
ncbi:pentatricopeptide repeat-containing protein At5g08510 isoform X2 [Phalaenopsis equestris]|uniref:pentatricopeptide repeat-containing protein At5g08510 isoform X2 n=1 Tax=Phalaenopsis equestris TaxID=78828 RepID=UPI0009E5CD27|nr:pentatricopeptide repeat-containing protein At5g08510 isoform X2 [Phalaenopsis equestris]